MHIIQLKIYSFLEGLKSKPYKVPVKLLAKFSEETAYALRSQFEREPRKFSLSMGNIGRPGCQLHFASRADMGQKSLISSFSIRNIYGGVCEALVIFLLHASGIEVLGEQERVSLNIGGRKVNGVLDVLLDLGDGPSVWDIKSASEWSFKHKFSNVTFEDFYRDDVFGYVPQLLLYADAKKVKPGGFIVFDKSSGEIAVVAIPEDYEALIAKVKKDAERKVAKLDGPLEREYLLEEEVFNRKATGKKVLGKVCSFCDYKFHCWTGLSLKAQENSKSKSPKMVYYVEG